MQKQDAEDESLFQCPERDRFFVLDHLERSEDPKLHGAVLSLFKPQTKHRKRWTSAGPNAVLSDVLPRPSTFVGDGTLSQIAGNVARFLPR